MKSLSEIKPIPKLVGFVGHAGVGKDPAAIKLSEEFDHVYAHAFADKLKETCASLFDLDEEVFYDSELKEQIIQPWGVSPRMIAQYMGTEVFREADFSGLFPNLNPRDIWVHLTALQLSNQTGYAFDENEVVILTDVRFQNEYDWIIENEGHVFHIERPGFEGAVGIPNHESEKGVNLWAHSQTHLIMNDSTEEYYYGAIRSKLKSLGYI